MTIVNTIPALAPYGGPFMPLNNVTPFTYRDGLTNSEILGAWQDWLNTDVLDFINTNFTELGGEFVTQVNLLIDTVNTQLSAETTTVQDALTAQTTDNATKIADLTTYVDNAIQSIITSTIAVTDPVVTALLNSLTSSTRAFLDGRYALKHRVDVKAAPYNAKGDGVTDDTAALAAAFTDALALGVTYEVPDGVYITDALTFDCGNAEFSMNMSGRFKRKKNSSRAPIITIKNASHFTALALRTDGNVANNFYNGFPVDEAKHDVTIDNCAKFGVVIIDSLNPSGDTLYIKGGPASNSADIQIGMVSSISDTTTGRNAVSIIKGTDITIGEILSINTGYQGQAAPYQIAMPGGLDIEPNMASDVVNGVTIGSLRVKSAGGAGFNIFSVYGQIITNVTVNAVVSESVAGKQSASVAGNIRGAQRVRVNSYQHDGTGLGNGFNIDDSTDIRIDVNIKNVTSNGLTLGATAALSKFKITGRVDTCGAHNIAIYAANNGQIDVELKNPSNANMCISKLATGASDNIRFRGDWSKDTTGGAMMNIAATVTRWVLDGVDATGWGNGARVVGASANSGVTKRNCPNLTLIAIAGSTYAGTFDVWCVGDTVWTTTPAASTPPGFVCVTAGTGGSGAVFKAMAALAA